MSQAKKDMVEIYDGSVKLASEAIELSGVARETQKGAEGIATAAEEQSSACIEVSASLEQQAKALAGAEQASQELENMAEDLKTSADITKSSEEVASAAEELSSTMEELNQSSNQIMRAIAQISQGADEQATLSGRVLEAIEMLAAGAKTANERSSRALEIGAAMSNLMASNKVSVDEMITAIATALEASRENLDEMVTLEKVTRNIDKVVDGIGNVATKTGMLAVSGAVEAARAREYGKGFAVVSTDIQNLADDAAKNAEEIFGVPMDFVEKSLTLPCASIQRINGHGAVEFEGSVIRVLPLGKALGLPGQDRRVGDDVYMMVFRVGAERLGVIVDAFHETLDVIIKPMVGVMADYPMFSGTALLGDGRVLIVLNLKEVLRCQ